MHVEEGVPRQVSTSDDACDLTLAPQPHAGTELGELRVEVAVLRERVAAAERVLAEREHRIRDLRGSLQIVAAGLVTPGGEGFPGSGSGNLVEGEPARGGRPAPVARIRKVQVDATRDRAHPEET